MAKIHLVQNPNPLIEGKRCLANCGAMIRSAAFIVELDADDSDNGLFRSGTCRKCREVKWIYRYLYAVMEGQDAKTLTNQA